MAKKLLILVLAAWFGSNVALPQVPQDAATIEFTRITQDFLNQNKYGEAIPLLEDLIKKYPATPIIDSMKFNLALAYLFDQKFTKAFDGFNKLTDKHTIIELREGAGFFGALAKTFESFGKQGVDRNKGIEVAIKLFSDFIDNKEFEKSIYREEAIFQRTKLFLILEKFDDVQKGVTQLFKEFPASPNRPDFYLTSGQSYMLLSFRMLLDQKKTREETLPIAQKAFDAFTNIKASDSAVVANDAAFKTAELRFLIADSDEDYRALIPIYRKVKPKNELLPTQDALVESIKKEKRDAAIARNFPLIRQLDLRLNKERDRLDQLKELFDPAVQSLVQTGRIYVKLKQPNEARVILRRAKDFCREEQRKEIAYSIILTYAMQGIVQKADQAFTDYQREFPNDPQADNVTVMIAGELFSQKNYEAAFEQYQKSIKDYPKGRFVDLAVMKSGATKVQMKKTDEGIKILQDFVATKQESPYFVESQLHLAQAFTDLKQYEEALKNYQAIVANPKATQSHPGAQYNVADTFNILKKYDEAVAAWKTYREKYPNHPDVSRALMAMADATSQKGDLPGAYAFYEQVVKEYASNADLATKSILNMAKIEQKQKKMPETLALWERVLKEYPTHPRSGEAGGNLAKYYEQERQQDKAPDYDKAASYYKVVIDKNFPTSAAWAQYNLGLMYFRAATSLGAYTALNDQEKATWNGYMKKAEEAYVAVLKKFSETTFVANALQELLKQVLIKTDANLLTLEQAQAYFKDLVGQFGTNDVLKSRILLAGAGIPYEKGNPSVALKSYEEILKQYPEAPFSAEDMNRYGSSLLTVKDYPKAQGIFKKLQETFPENKEAQANSIYGQGAALLFQNQVAEAGKFFEELKAKHSSSSKIIEATLGIGLAAEQGGKTDESLTSYKSIIMNPKATNELKAKATLGRARIFELMGMYLPDPNKKELPAASTEYDRVASLYAAEKEPSAEALYRLGLIYSKNGKPEEAKQAWTKCVEKYKGTEWATQSEAKLRQM